MHSEGLVVFCTWRGLFLGGDMAENKTSFLLYTDLIHTVSRLSDELAGRLFKHILSYVNDQNPQTDDLIIQIAFEPVKQQLKRDLRKYKALCKKNKENIEARWNKKDTTVYDGIQPNSKHTDNDSDNDNDTDNDKEKEIKKKKRTQFKKPTLEEVKQYFTENNYSEEGAEKAFYHYDLADWHDVNGKPVSNWKSKMHTNWFRPEFSTLKKLAV